MKHRIIGWMLGAMSSLLMVGTALARKDEEVQITDARLEAYAKKVMVTEGNGTALTYLLLILLAVICLAVLFKNARRTHLD